jgi:hypothetical protein
MIWSKNSELVWYSINLYCEKTKEEDVNEEDEDKIVEEKAIEVEDENKKKEKKKKNVAAVEHQWELVNKNKTLLTHPQS